jgi:hypothetical protein
MTPTEKAKELVDKFTTSTRFFDLTRGWVDALPEAKKAATIAVEEILNAEMEGEIIPHGLDRIKFWNNVKEEINKL